MADEKKDQGTAVTPGQSDGKDYTLPDKDFFSGGQMMDFIANIEREKPAPAAKAPEPPKVKMKDGKPCPECPDEEPAAKPAETRKPYKVLKVEGKETPVYSEDELVELAQKGAHYTKKRQQDAEWEKDLDERQSNLEKLEPYIERIVQFIDGGGKLPTVGSPEVITSVETAPAEPEEEILDPAAEKKFKRLEATLAELKKENETLKTQTQREKQTELFSRAQKELTETFDAVKKEHPFEDVVDEEGGRNVSQEMFAGLFSVKVNRDALRAKNEKGFKMKSAQEYMAETAKDLAFLEKKFKANAGLPAELTPDVIKKNYPQVAESLGQEALDTYLKKVEEGGAPVIRPSKTEPSLTTPKKEITGLDDAIDKGLADPEIAEAMEVLGRQHKQFYSGGK